ncbi:sensor histidine kinase [Paraflavitalea pollutisoli]|uniref:sensor histidine kinase n=1 Tax=Paraflavitalea pollutisoli TaxID=3034143 RepID=UPI0023EAC745|nr:sensor histidine kinase [Paraflavitalea sp. H1-2-19X]
MKSTYIHAFETSSLPVPVPSPRPATGIIRRLRCLLLLFFYALVSPTITSAQEYNYIRYDTKDGLAGSTVYDMVQDQEGFMWFATEAGLSRFDGTRFKNFTTADGLPDVEVIKLYVDYTGRVWIAPFKNTLCYYYKGKIHTAANDSLLKLVKLDAAVEVITGDYAGNIFMSGGRFAYILQTKPGQEKLLRLLPFQRHFVNAIPNFNSTKGILLFTEDSSFLWREGQLSYWASLVNSSRKKMFPAQLSSDKSAKYISYTNAITSFYRKWSIDKKSINTFLIGNFDGAYSIDSVNFGQLEEKFLAGKKVNAVWIDYENNLWFGTNGQGIYKLTSRNFKTYGFTGNQSPEIFSIVKVGNAMLIGGDYNKLYEFSAGTVKSSPLVKTFEEATQGSYSSNRLLTILPTSNGSLAFGFDLYLFLKKGVHEKFSILSPIKALLEVNRDTLLVATGRNVVHVDATNLAVLDTIWPSRATSVGYHNGQVYIGTVDGLNFLESGHQARYLGTDEPALRYRIAAISKANDGVVWVATFGGGIIGLKGDRVFARISSGDGLTSDVCRSLFIGKDHLWVGTDKGVNKVDLNNLSSPPRQYTVSDGLPSNIINAIYVDRGQVHIGSPAGLTTFDERQVSNFSRCDLKLLGVSISGQPVNPDSIGHLAYKDNNIAIDFVAISFKSAGDILYRYRLQGLKETWDSTRQNSLSYPSLPSGQYQLELTAANKFGVVSAPIIIPFTVDAPFWQTWWFLTIVALLTITLTALLVGARFSVLRKREREKASLEQKVSKLEQLALLAQMNPHFIFNCLNSIQAFIIQNDLLATNQYLTEFARLIRQTMDSAAKGTITLEDEISYLSRYIELERMRFGKSFDFEISIDEQIDVSYLSIPSMMLQPYVENSIRHGIRYKKGQGGLVEVKFRQYGSQLSCIVEDNGIGRQEALRLRSKVHVEYQSKGMTLAANRIQALNRQFNETISINIVDKVDETGKASGTRVEITFPLSLLPKLS